MIALNDKTITLATLKHLIKNCAWKHEQQIDEADHTRYFDDEYDQFIGTSRMISKHANITIVYQEEYEYNESSIDSLQQTHARDEHFLVFANLFNERFNKYFDHVVDVLDDNTLDELDYLDVFNLVQQDLSKKFTNISYKHFFDL